jgi:hypothetical protein
VESLTTKAVKEKKITVVEAAELGDYYRKTIYTNFGIRNEDTAITRYER